MSVADGAGPTPPRRLYLRPTLIPCLSCAQTIRKAPSVLSKEREQNAFHPQLLDALQQPEAPSPPLNPPKKQKLEIAQAEAVKDSQPESPDAMSHSWRLVRHPNAP